MILKIMGGTGEPFPPCGERKRGKVPPMAITVYMTKKPLTRKYRYRKCAYVMRVFGSEFQVMGGTFPGSPHDQYPAIAKREEIR